MTKIAVSKPGTKGSKKYSSIQFPLKGEKIIEAYTCHKIASNKRFFYHIRSSLSTKSNCKGNVGSVQQKHIISLYSRRGRDSFCEPASLIAAVKFRLTRMLHDRILK